jgi:hypothetical protein
MRGVRPGGRKWPWILVSVPVVIAALSLAWAIREGVPVRRLAGLLAIATAAGAVYLTGRSAVLKMVARNRWVPLLFDVLFAFAFAALLWWLYRYPPI